MVSKSEVFASNHNHDVKVVLFKSLDIFWKALLIKIDSDRKKVISEYCDFVCVVPKAIGICQYPLFKSIGTQSLSQLAKLQFVFLRLFLHDEAFIAKLQYDPSLSQLFERNCIYYHLKYIEYCFVYQKL